MGRHRGDPQAIHAVGTVVVRGLSAAVCLVTFGGFVLLLTHVGLL